MTNFHSIIAAAIDEGDLICLSSHPYSGFQLYHESISTSDLYEIARESKRLADQVRLMGGEAGEVLALLECGSERTA